MIATNSFPKGMSRPYAVPGAPLPFPDEDVARLERLFGEGRALLPVYPTPERERLNAQLGQMVETALLQPKGQVRRLLRYPVFVAYAEVLLGR